MEASPLLGAETRVLVGDACDAADASTSSSSRFFSVTPKISARAIAAVATAALACAGVAATGVWGSALGSSAATLGASLSTWDRSGWDRTFGATRGVSASASIPASTPISPARLGAEQEAEPHVDKDTTITVGFLSSGDFFWFPMVKLLEVALPGVKIRLTDPTYNWRALGLEEAKSLDDVEVTEGPVEPELVLEGPDIFQTACFWENLPWVQTTAEPTMFFNTWNWCKHDQPAFLRLDTGLGHYKQPTVYDPNATTFLWSPYAMTQVFFNADPWLIHRDEAFKGDNERGLGRPYFVGWVSANCQEHRSHFFDALVDVASADKKLNGTVHGLGPCNHNKDWSATDQFPPRHLTGPEIYKNYRWVLALENVAEPGYLTEKLVNAQASGAVPIYYGDSRAARKVFKKDSYVDAFSEWRKMGVTPSSPPSVEDWRRLAERVAEIDKDEALYESYAKHDSVVQDYPEGEDGVAEEGEGEFEKTVHYPNEPFPLIGRALEQQTDLLSGASGEAVKKIRELFPSKFARLTAAQNEGGR
jgi:hypothetical protein